MGLADSMTYLNMSSVNASEPVLPRGYSLPHLIPVAIIMALIILLIVFGNLLVIIAIATDRNLKMIQNWFIASLAVADCLLGLVIMPFSLANELMGYWYFGSVWCDLWKSIDVLLCTASIMTICLISLDRYWSITRAIEYSQKRTPKRAMFMIGAVWGLSMIICLPPLIGWKNPLPVSDYPMCEISSEMGYIIYSSMGSFYIPAVIMVVVYYQIYREAKSRARRSQLQNRNWQNKKPNKCKLFGGRKNTQNEKESNLNKINSLELITCEENTKSRTLSEDESTWPVYRDMPDKENDPSKGNEGSSSHKSTEAIALLNKQGQPENNLFCPPHGHNKTLSNESVFENNSENSQIDHISKSESEASNDDATTLTDKSPPVESKPEVTNTTFSCQHHDTIQNPPKPLMMFQENEQNIAKNDVNGNDAVRELERQKRKLAKARERRATIVLGIVMAAFIICWFPFFFLYNVNAFCHCIPGLVFNIFFWAGYCNSALNPIIYTVFNQDFRNAFHKIVFEFELFKSR